MTSQVTRVWLTTDLPAYVKNCEAGIATDHDKHTMT